MASVLLSSVTGGGGGSFIADSAANGGFIASGSSGTLVTITPPSGQRVILNAFMPGAAAAIVDITITFGIRAVISSKTLLALPNQELTPNSFVIGQANYDQGSAINYQNAGFINNLEGKADETVVVSTGTSTAAKIHYSYLFGE